jgi:HEAT repeat protein
MSPAALLLNDLLAAMNGIGADAEAEYRRLLDAIRKQAPEVVITIARREQECAARDYSTRWGLVFAASELNHPAALPYLSNVVLTPLPAETSRNPHSFSVVAEETILRTTAIEGIGYLAAAGRKEALDTLLSFLAIPSLSIRRAAVQAILSTPSGRRLRRRVAESLPRDQRFLLDLRRPDVREIPQIRNPEKNLSDAGRRARKEAPADHPSESREKPTRNNI